MKYVVAKSYYGLGGNLSVLSCAMLYAKKTGRKIVVDWRGGSYGDEDDYFFNLFQPIERMERIATLPAGLSVFPYFWLPYYKEAPLYKTGVPLTSSSTDLIFSHSTEIDIDNFEVVVIARDGSYFHRPEHALSMREIFQELKPAAAISMLIDRFKAENFAGEIIGVHYRHGNGELTVVPPDFQWFVKSVRDLQEKSKSKKCKIFVATDCKAALDAFVNVFGDLVISYHKDYPDLGVGGMHYKNEKSEKLNSAIEALIDMKLLSACDFFVGSKSFFSSCANLWSEGFVRENSRWYLPVLRSFKPESKMTALPDNKRLLLAFGGADYPVDNIFYTDDDEGYHIYFQQSKVGFVGYDLSPDLIFQIKSAIFNFRLY